MQKSAAKVDELQRVTHAPRSLCEKALVAYAFDLEQVQSRVVHPLTAAAPPCPSQHLSREPLCASHAAPPDTAHAAGASLDLERSSQAAEHILDVAPSGGYKPLNAPRDAPKRAQSRPNFAATAEALSPAALSAAARSSAGGSAGSAAEREAAALEAALAASLSEAKEAERRLLVVQAHADRQRLSSPPQTAVGHAGEEYETLLREASEPNTSFTAHAASTFHPIHT